MSGQTSDPILRRYTYRQASEPSFTVDGVTWVDTSGNNVETKQYSESAGDWELVVARGPDTPEHAVEGSLWRDTTAGELKVYNGTSWGSVGSTAATVFTRWDTVRATIVDATSGDPATGNPEGLFDGDGNNPEVTFDTVGQFARADFDRTVFLGAWRFWNEGTGQNQNGQWTLDLVNPDGSINTAVDTISTIGPANSPSGWFTFTPQEAIGVRLRATVMDAFTGENYATELEFRSEAP